jgi:defect-in-organelle-trafficking protein DotB
MDSGSASVTAAIDALALKIGTWPDEPLRIFDEHLDQLLLWCAQNRASDTSIQTDKPVYIEVDGILFPVTRRNLDSADLANVLNKIYGPDALAKLASGRDLDLSYEVRPDRNTRIRFRVNITAIMSKGRDSVQVTLRTLPSLPPTMRELEIESKIIDNWSPRQGLVLVTGPTLAVACWLSASRGAARC